MTLNPRRFAAGALCLLLLLPAVPARAADSPSELTLEQIMADPDWIGNPPENPYWSDDGRSVYYERERDGVGRNPRDLYRLDLATGKTTKIEPADRGKADAPGGDWSPDFKKKVWAREGDVFVKDLATGAVRQITRTAEEETAPFFLADGKRIGFYQENNVFTYDLATGLLAQAADLELAKDPAEEDEPSYLAAQQTRLFDVIRQQQERKRRDREESRANQKADPTRPPLPFYLGKEISIEAVRLSPSGDWLALVTAPKRGEGDLKPAKLPVWVTESGNVETRDVRAKVGVEEYVPHSVVLLDLVKHERHDLDLTKLPGIKEDPLKALREAAEAKKKAAKARSEEKDAKPEEPKKEEAKKEEDKPRPIEVLDAVWSDDGRQLALALRARDNKDRWIATWDTTKPEVNEPTVRDRLTDPAWINWNFNELGWLRDSETLWFLSEETGFSGLYLLPTQTGQKKLLTPPGRYEVSAPRLSRDGRALYYAANQEHPGKYDAWRVDVGTGKAEQLTRLGGLTDALPSPDEKQLLILHSGINRPNELFVQPNRPSNRSDAEARQVTNTRTASFLAQDWALPEIVPIPSTHGATAPVYARVYTPKGFDPARKYPAVMFVHGAGYLQNVHYGWSNYFREYMFHTFLTRHGYVVIDMDYRASAGYGRDWRTAIYRQMGHPELEDFQDGVAWLVANKSVDPRRVGVYGGSYGGFMTYMALFRAPDLFAAGAALRPVSDWAHYNEEYTGNILNRPEVDPEAYEKSSPIEYAAGLQKPLLICDGMLDSNVFFQDNVRLVQRLIELKKENFELAVYPVEDHGFVQPTSWLDEYRRVFKLFETHVK
ncbi:MAG TPA: prolyl oligopeptidase family serine peptidase [Thermoanaerobaculia bacterium]|jgi:dipeptidyl aminopeptidase/acylaminoacyl peptidase|nr:prolyl oligopeptidase family serine peptidase [Thermoanaerobaculia bacterium]